MPAWSAVSRTTGCRRTPQSGAAGLVEGRVDLPARPRRHARDALELVAASPRGAARASRSAPISARLRAGPTPGSASRIDSFARASRRVRWKPSAKRCASSLIRWRSWRPAEPRSSTTGSGPPGDEHLLLALRERDHGHPRQVVARASPRAPPTAGPCRRRRRRGWARPRSPRRSPSAVAERRRAKRRDTTSPIIAKSSCPPAADRRTCGSGPSSATASSKTTIEPTGDSSWMFEMSKHSMRIGRLSRLSASRSSSSASIRRTRLRSAASSSFSSASSAFC